MFFEDVLKTFYIFQMFVKRILMFWIIIDFNFLAETKSLFSY